MPHAIAYFPSEILNNIFFRLEAYDVFVFAIATGDRLLSTKVQQGGFTRLAFYDYSLRKSAFKILQHFPSITRLYIQVNAYKGDIDLFALPATLLSLEILAPCRYWLIPCAHSPKCPPLNRMYSCETPLFNFKRHLPQLQSLTLNCWNHLNLTTRRRDNTALILRCLPTTLQVFNYSHLAEVDPKYWINMPAGLEITRMFEYVDSKFLASIALHAPQVRLSHVMFKDTPQNLVITHSNQPRQLSLWMGGSRPSDGFWPDTQELFLSRRPPPSTNLDVAYPPYLTALHGFGWVAHCTELKECPEKIRWPTSLKTLEDGSINPPTWSNTLYLPSTITRLEMGISQEGKLHFPSTLTSMKVCYGSKDSAPLHLFEALPPLLVDLTLTLLTIHWDDRCLSLLPRRLPYFALSWTSAFELTSSFIEHVPSTLDILATNAACSDTLLPGLGSKIVFFISSALNFTGTVSDPEATELYYDTQATWHYVSQDVVRFRLREIWESSALRFHPMTLPSALTHLKISRIDRDTSIFTQLSLPNLHTIELPLIEDIDWTAWELPAMTHLIQSGYEATPSDAVAGFPKTVTRLSFTRKRHYLPGIPLFLMHQLEHLDSQGSISLVTSAFSKLKTLHAETAGYASLDALEDLKLAFDKSLDWPMMNCPNLRKIASPNVFWTPTCEDIAKYAHRLNLIECNWISLTELPDIDTDLIKEHLLCDAPRIERVLALQMQRKFSCLKMPSGGRARIHDLPMASLRMLLGLMSDYPVKELELAAWRVEDSKLGTLLPSSLTSLSLPRYLSSGVTKHLPRSITRLRVDSGALNCDSIRWLPSGLVSLQIQLTKFLVHYAKALPSTLQELTLSATVVGSRAFSHLPSSLTSLEMLNAIPLDCFYRGLPPNLNRLACLPFLGDVDKNLIRTQLPQLEVDCPPHVPPYKRPIRDPKVDMLLKEVDAMEL